MEDHLARLALDMGRRARAAGHAIAVASTEAKNAFLNGVAVRLIERMPEIQKVNEQDLAAGKKAGLSSALLDRLALNEKRIRTMADSLIEIAALPDPIGEVSGMWVRPNGLRVGRMRIPLGVIGIIYEARPNVTSDAAGLCVKAGNAVILRGGSEALESNRCIAALMREVLHDVGLPEDVVQLVPKTDYGLVDELLELEDLIDLIVPRGGETLIRKVVEKSRIPVVKHYKGVCHVYVDESADLEMAQRIAFNAKVQRPSVCNAMETLLVHQAVAQPFLGALGPKLVSAGVELRGCERTRAILEGTKTADKEDWFAEYLDLILAIRVVDSMEEAILHIQTFGSLHTESIVTRDYARAHRFVREVDSSTVLVNASTRFSDGFELGLGAEVGISTSKVHSFGPMGLEGLTTRKFIVYGDGQVRT